MGAALAASLLSKNWRVALVDIQAPPATALGPNAEFFKADVASYSSQAAMLVDLFNPNEGAILFQELPASFRIIQYLYMDSTLVRKC